MIFNINARIQMITCGNEPRPYLFYLIRCTDKTDCKQNLVTKFRITYDDGVNFVARVNDVHDVKITNASLLDDKIKLMRWLVAVNDCKGFYLEKTYFFTNILLKPKTESKFVSLGNDYFTTMINILNKL